MVGVFYTFIILDQGFSTFLGGVLFAGHENLHASPSPNI